MDIEGLTEALISKLVEDMVTDIAVWVFNRLRPRITATVAAMILSLPIWSEPDIPTAEKSQTRTDSEGQALR